MTESPNSLFKREPTYPRGPWQGLSDLEHATLEPADWHNHRPSHSALIAGRGNYTTPADHQTAYHRQHSTATTEQDSRRSVIGNQRSFDTGYIRQLRHP